MATGTTREAGDREDADLIRATLAGDRRAFATLLQRHYHDLLRTLERITRNPQDAEDAAQDAVLRAFRALDRYDAARGAFRPWLWTIAIRVALRLVTHRSRKDLSLEALTDGADPDRPRSDAWLHDRRALERTDAAVLHRELEDALDHLDPPHRAILVLAVLEERSYADIAEILEIPIGTVMSRLHRARAKLRVQLTDRAPLGESHE